MQAVPRAQPGLERPAQILARKRIQQEHLAGLGRRQAVRRPERWADNSTAPARAKPAAATADRPGRSRGPGRTPGRKSSPACRRNGPGRSPASRAQAAATAAGCSTTPRGDGSKRSHWNMLPAAVASVILPSAASNSGSAARGAARHVCQATFPLSALTADTTTPGIAAACRTWKIVGPMARGIWRGGPLRRVGPGGRQLLVGRPHVEGRQLPAGDETPGAVQQGKANQSRAVLQPGAARLAERFARAGGGQLPDVDLAGIGGHEHAVVAGRRGRVNVPFHRDRLRQCRGGVVDSGPPDSILSTCSVDSSTPWLTATSR